jgi:hypothetical protein
VKRGLEICGRKRSWYKFRCNFGICRRDWGKLRKSSVMIVEVRAEIFTEHYPNASQKCYCFSQRAQALVINKKFWEELIAYFPWYDTGYIENDASKYSSTVACVFVSAVTFPQSSCLAMIGFFFTEPLPGNHKGIFAEPLPSNNRRIHKHAHKQKRELISLLCFDVELRLSPRWVGGNIGSTDATKTCHDLNVYIFETNNRKAISNTSLDSL